MEMEQYIEQVMGKMEEYIAQVNASMVGSIELDLQKEKMENTQKQIIESFYNVDSIYLVNLIARINARISSLANESQKSFSGAMNTNPESSNIDKFNHELYNRAGKREAMAINIYSSFSSQACYSLNSKLQLMMEQSKEIEQLRNENLNLQGEVAFSSTDFGENPFASETATFIDVDGTSKNEDEMMSHHSKR